ncbi:nucleoside phosphorylase domain-containing protein [Mucidula mucida]|nr:nucleoside phosphorylase domain-containing protein [Mucidula mucida]
MKDTLTDANFPRTADLRVYHLGLRPGEVANRLITVGSPSRAVTIASHLDATPKPFQLSSERGFLTITGMYKGVPVSICSIGMGTPNMDFFVREVRECLIGDMLIIRLGSCGGLIDVPVGTVVVPKACIAVTRNVDFNFVDPSASSNEKPYWISKPVFADPTFHDVVESALNESKPEGSTTKIFAGIVNASADSFYASQGRQTSFPDCNQTLIQQIIDATEDVATLEMETHHLYHLAACWSARRAVVNSAPLATGPVIGEHAPVQRALAAPGTVIRAAAAQMIFASRTSQDFITPAQVQETEKWTGKGVLEALIRMELSDDRTHPPEGSVWEKK